MQLLSTQDWPDGHWPGPVQLAAASAAVRQTPSFAQVPIRLSTVRQSDRLITIDRGRLAEDGTHDDLVRAGGRYASLYRLQAGIHEVR